VLEELASLKGLHGTTTGEDLFLSVCETMKELELPWIKLKGVTTDGAQSIAGKKTGLVSRNRRETTNIISKSTWNATMHH
jgi:hypothetical protein